MAVNRLLIIYPLLIHKSYKVQIENQYSEHYGLPHIKIFY